MALQRIVIILLCALLGLGLAYHSQSRIPRQYRSSAAIQIKAAGNVSAEKEFQGFQRKEILYPVIDSLQLQNRWTERFHVSSREQAYYVLISLMSLSQVRNTELVQLSITESDPQEAAELANAIVTEYVRRAKAQEQDQVSLDLDTLKKEVERQRQKVDDLGKKADQVRQQSGKASPQFLEAEREYHINAKILEAAEQHLQRARVDIKMPSTPAVIWEKAEPSSIPRPNYAVFRLVGGMLLGALVGAILSLLVRK